MKRVWRRPALAGFAVFVCGSAVTGDFFPFTQVPMYAAVGANGVRTTAAVPVFLVNGVRADIRDYDRFLSAADTADMLPWARCRAVGGCDALPCSMNYVVDNDRRWVLDHAAQSTSTGANATVPVTYAYLLLEQRPDGTVSEELRTVWTGSALPRS
jgi:hypothetical protein